MIITDITLLSLKVQESLECQMRTEVVGAHGRWWARTAATSSLWGAGSARLGLAGPQSCCCCENNGGGHCRRRQARSGLRRVGRILLLDPAYSTIILLYIFVHAFHTLHRSETQNTLNVSKRWFALTAGKLFFCSYTNFAWIWSRKTEHAKLMTSHLRRFCACRMIHLGNCIPAPSPVDFKIGFAEFACT